VTKRFYSVLQIVAVLLAYAGLEIMPASANTVIYDQPPSYNGAYSSNNDTSHEFVNYTAYDNFALNSTSDITSVEWIGMFYNPSTHGTITGFTLNFYADNAGIPGALLFSTGDVAGNAGETFLQTDEFGQPTYLYSLATSFVASADVQYWLSIVPDLSLLPQWGWEDGTGGNGAAYQCVAGNCGSIPSDLAFALYTGAPVPTPEPASVFLSVAALVVALVPKLCQTLSRVPRF
jgi:hypothetical protein